MDGPMIEEAWAALAMIREAVETLGPVGAVPRGDEYTHSFTDEANAIVAGIMAMAGPAIAPAPAAACSDCRGSREVAYQWGPAIDDWEMRPCSRCVPERCASCGGPNPHHVPAPRQVRYIKQGETIEEVTLIGHAPVKDGKFNPWLVIIERADGSRWRVPEMSLYRSHAGIERVPPKNWLTYEGQPEVVSSGSAPVSACFIPGDRGLSDGGVP